MNEADVSRKLREGLVAGGALCWKLSDRFHASRPDLLLLHQGVTGYIETKVYPRGPTPLQENTLTELVGHGAPVFLLTYYKRDKSLVLQDMRNLDKHQHKDYKETVAWLLRHLSSSTSKSLLTA